MTKPRESDRQYVPPGAKLPVAPESGEVLPVNVTGVEVDRAIALLAEFPAEPAADSPGAGVDVLVDPDRVREARERSGGGTATDGTSILFISDTHLGYENRVETGSGKKMPWISDISSKYTFSQAALIAMREDVDAVIHTGDMLDHEVDGATLEHAERVLESLADCDIPVYCILGTHDHQSGNPRYQVSVNGIAWLKKQVRNGYLTELTTNPSGIPGGTINVYGVSADNVGIDDVGNYDSMGWSLSDISFSGGSAGPNVLCLHDGVTPYRGADADVDLDRLLARSSVSFDCVLIGDEHHPKNNDFENGYSFTTSDGTPVFYTGPAIRISRVYHKQDAFVTELSITDTGVMTKRHSV